jgi:hypothetical protein
VIDAHHFLPKRRIKEKLGKDTEEARQALVDVRNGVPLCRRHHDLVEQGFIASPEPPTLAFFLADHGLRCSPAPARPRDASYVTEQKDSPGGKELPSRAEDHEVPSRQRGKSRRSTNERRAVESSSGQGRLDVQPK